MRANRVVLAVTGSIAAYKACEVLRRLQDHGVDVKVAMTRSATEFVRPLTFAALSGHGVIAGMFAAAGERHAHVRWAEECDAFCAVPATADFLAKMALGIADDFPSTVHLAVTAPVLAAPAMEDDMWAHPAVRRNIATLRERGVSIVEPETGHLASGRSGVGRLADPGRIVDAILLLLQPTSERPLAGSRVLVTAGPTREHIDPARVISNPSSGKMGYALAEEALRLGAEVVLVSGPVSLEAPQGAVLVPVVSAEEMAEAVLDRALDSDYVVMAAAVADYRPAERSDRKLSKPDGATSLELVPTPDILAHLQGLQGGRTVVGFAAETDDLEERSRAKMERKGCDLIVANRIGLAGSGFEADTNEVVVLDRLGGHRQVARASKTRVARIVWEAVLEFEARASRVASQEPA